MATILTDRTHREVDARVDGEDLWVHADALEEAIGWELKPEGLCRGPVCVPLPPGREREFVDGDSVNVAAFWRHTAKPLLHDAAGEVWILGEDAGSRAAEMSSLEAPDFALPDLEGREHRLSDYRGRKVLLVTWASW